MSVEPVDIMSDTELFRCSADFHNILQSGKASAAEVVTATAVLSAWGLTGR